MKPKTKYQKEIVSVQRKLPKVKQSQVEWAYKNTLGVYAVISRNRLFCLECGHKWLPTKEQILIFEQPQKNGPNEHVNCPSCKMELVLSRYNQTRMDYSSFWSVWTTFKGYQVIRIFTNGKILRKNKKAQPYNSENLQYWIDKDGIITTFSQVCAGYTGSFSGDLELRSHNIENNTNYCFDLKDKYIYPKRDLLPEILRNGYKGDYLGIPPQSLFAGILNQYGETVFKSGRFEMFKILCYNTRLLKKLWPAIKISIRHKYQLKNRQEITDWIDYVELLIYFRKDIHNPFYVCPKNLKAAHDEYVTKKRISDAEMRKRRSVKEGLKEQVSFEDMKGKFFPLSFKDGNLTIDPMRTVEEVLQDGEKMHHCIFASRYHLKQHTLLLSAKWKGESVESIEVCLKSFKVIQSRGLQNKPTKHHKAILDLMRKKMFLIKRIADPPRKKTAKKKPKKHNIAG